MKLQKELRFTVFDARNGVSGALQTRPTRTFNFTELLEYYNSPENEKLCKAILNAPTKKIKKRIVALASFCAYGRCVVERDYRNRHVTYLPKPEGSARLVKQFVQIGMGLALAHGKNTIDTMLYESIKKIGRDLISA